MSIRKLRIFGGKPIYLKMAFTLNAAPDRPCNKTAAANVICSLVEVDKNHNTTTFNLKTARNLHKKQTENQPTNHKRNANYPTKQ
jgi:hypothetical protein